ncbi:Uncharacterised protein [Candidatus Norongarragalina meridionalis]|nr:Uncharacterised protein [Candidatus Norongarragalina meridionalis]
MKTVTQNIRLDAYANRILEVTKAVYGLPNKSEAANRIIREFGPKIIEPEINPEVARHVLKDTAEWERKYNFKRKMTLKELEEL